MSSTISRMILAVTIAAVAGCTPAPTASPRAPDATASPSAAEGALRLVGRDDGLVLTITFDRAEVPSGGVVNAVVELRNESERVVPWSGPGCGVPATIVVLLAVPTLAPGRAWEGIAGVFKDYALTEGLGPGGAPATDDVTAPFGPICRIPPTEGGLPPGAVVRATVSWTADFVPGVPARPGPVTVRASILHDPLTPPSPPPRKPGQHVASRDRTWSELVVEGGIQITGHEPSVLSAAQALDVVLEDGRFAAWLSQQPPTTWGNANLWLDTDGWHVELFREIGVPRDFALAYVDPFTAELRRLDICSAPCDR